MLLDPRFVTLVVLFCACGPGKTTTDQVSEAPEPVVQEAPVTPPRLNNREEVMKYRDEAARQFLPVGDSITINVNARIDTAGVPRQPEIKDEIANERLVGAAISVVQLMRFTPAQRNGQPTSVLIKIPVRFVHR